MNALLKKRYFQKKVIRESCAIYAYECSPGLSVLTKWPVFLQNPSGNPNSVLYRFCEYFSPVHTCLLHYTKVLCLATRRLFQLRDELLQFCKEKSHIFRIDLKSKNFSSRLTCLSDISELLNNLNLPLQGFNRIVTELSRNRKRLSRIWISEY